MNINNVIKALRQSRKLAPISVYYSNIQPSIPADRELFDEVMPILKLLLKAFKKAGFSDYLSKWGELTLFSPTLGLEIMISIEPNSSYMSAISMAAIEKNGYEVLEVQLPSKHFVLNYFFCGTKSKWRQIPFDLHITSVDSAYIEFILPLLSASKPFQGRLKSSFQLDKNKQFVSKDSVYALACYAIKNSNSVYGLAQLCHFFESKYVRECLVGRYGAIIATDQWRGINSVRWQKNDIKFIEKFLPEILEHYHTVSVSIRSVLPIDNEHQFLLEALDKELQQKYYEIGDVDNWLNTKCYFADNGPPNALLSSKNGTERLLSAIIK